MNPSNRALRVYFDHQIFMMQAHGGVSRYFTALARHLPDDGVEPRIIAPFYKTRSIAALPRPIVRGGMLEGGRWTDRLARLADAAAVAAATRIDPPDLVHETYYSARRLAPRRLPVVLTVYDMIHELVADDVPDKITAMLKRAAVERADRVLCISQSTRNDLVALYPQVADRAVVTLLGFDAHPLAEAPAELERPYLIYVGPRRGYKNFAMLLEAWSSSPGLQRDVDIVCVGGGAFSTAEFAAIAAARGDASRVRQVAADDATLQSLYRGAAAFVYPSRYEGFGIPPLEAMAQRCPVVCFAVASMPEVCGDAAAFPEAMTSQALRATIERVVEDEPYAALLRERGSHRVTQFSWQRCARETAAIYRETA